MAGEQPPTGLGGGETIPDLFSVSVSTSSVRSAASNNAANHPRCQYPEVQRRSPAVAVIVPSSK